MSNKYFQNVDGVMKDFYDLCETKVYTAAPWCSNRFTGDTERQKAGQNTTNVTMPNYIADGSAITAVKKGYFPTYVNTDSAFHTITSSGQYTLERTDSALKIGSTSFTASDFRCNAIPHEIIILIAGGGGGGGGNGYWEIGKTDTFNRICGGAGGGGGVAVAKISLDTYPKLYITVGAGGGVGTTGSTTSNSNGGTGGTGGKSSVAYNAPPSPGFVGPVQNTDILTANGGIGGGGGQGSGGEGNVTPGTGGSGGSASKSSSLLGSSATGGSGNYYNNHNRTGISSTSFAPHGTDTGCSTITWSPAHNDNNGNTLNVSDSEGNGSYFSGGCSYLCGAYPIGIGGNTIYFAVPNYGGGGGGGGSTASVGGAGLAIFFY